MTAFEQYLLEPSTQELRKKHHIPRIVLEQIFEAGKLAERESILELIQEGHLIVNIHKHR